jgi:hypothetical protein
MFAITMQVAVSSEMRCGLLGMSAESEKNLDGHNRSRPEENNKVDPVRDNQTSRFGGIAIWQATIDTAPETRFTVNPWLEF